MLGNLVFPAGPGNDRKMKKMNSAKTGIVSPGFPDVAGF
jgi:hypothetical protein